MGLFGKKMTTADQLKKRCDGLAAQRAKVAGDLAQLRAQHGAVLAADEDPGDLEGRIATLCQREAGYDEALRLVEAELTTANAEEEAAARRAAQAEAQRMRTTQHAAARELDQAIEALAAAHVEFVGRTTNYEAAARRAEPKNARRLSFLQHRSMLTTALWASAPELAKLLGIHRPAVLGGGGKRSMAAWLPAPAEAEKEAAA